MFKLVSSMVASDSVESYRKEIGRVLLVNYTIHLEEPFNTEEIERRLIMGRTKVARAVFVTSKEEALENSSREKTNCTF